MRCPACNITLELGEIRFSESFRCRRCGAELSVSRNYLRLIGVACIPLAIGLLWIMQVRGLLLYLLWLPMEVLLGVLMIKLITRFVPWALVRDNFERITKLNL